MKRKLTVMVLMALFIFASQRPAESGVLHGLAKAASRVAKAPLHAAGFALGFANRALLDGVAAAFDL